MLLISGMTIVLRVKSCFLNILINHDTEVVSPICRDLSQIG
ncbi:MAG: hypothetical protein RIR83_1226 [Pseudomonadota bacterium]|jgi:hypothetical protein